MLPLLACVALQAAPAFQFDVSSGSGLTVTIDGIPLIRGSWFQYYEPDWTKGYYSSLGQPQQIKKIDADTIEVDFKGDRQPISGSQIYHRQGTELKVSYRYEWDGDHPIKVEMAAGLLWAPAFANGLLALPGNNLAAPKSVDLRPTASDINRELIPDSPTVLFSLPVADATVQGSKPLTLFDAR